MVLECRHLSPGAPPGVSVTSCWRSTPPGETGTFPRVLGISARDQTAQKRATRWDWPRGNPAVTRGGPMTTAVVAPRSRAGARDVTMTAHAQAVEGAIRTMQSHLREVLTLDDLASVACLSPAHFT